ncbi:MAG: DPP IV N-terminal domain-containing protein [Acidobacteriota bacterium]|nr:DPP IV N-terminal domain-containing protein [Acidobacteriota bacterium]
MRLRLTIRPLRASACVLAATLLAALPAAAQAPANGRRVLTDADYHRAEQFMPYNTDPLVLHSGVRATWLWHDPDDRFWYRTRTERGEEFVLVDPVKQTRGPAFDQEKLAAGLSTAAGTHYEAYALPFRAFTFSDDRQSVWFDLGAKRWTCSLQGYTCTSQDNKVLKNESISPDHTKAVFIRDWNLWVRDLKTGKETPLTTDGVENFGYATDNAGWERTDRPIVLWSPDSTKVATFQQDQRKDGDMYLVNTQVGHPKLEAWKYPLPGDKNVTMIERVIIDVDHPKVVRLKMPPDQHRSTLCDDVACGGVWSDVQWSPDSKHLAFISTSRDHQHEVVRVADAGNGDVRDVFHEDVTTFYDSAQAMAGRANWAYLPQSNEIIWYSERDNWGQLYLYDLKTGALKQQITTGDGNVDQILYVDAPHREIYFIGNGKQPGIDPYYQHLYKIGFDGKGLQMLTPVPDADHDVSMSDDGRFFVDAYSTPVVPPVAFVGDDQGKQVMALEKADISRLLAIGWKPPVQIVVKARDGKTDLYGLMYRPTDFDPSKRYPIINHIYPGPQTGSVGSRTFRASHGDTQSLAELGFIVVEIDGMGTPWRSHAFHAAYYGDMGDNTLPDQVAGMKELAAKDPWIDLDKAGIYGHSGGGFATADAMFTYPDFFKVGISEAGNHDNRVYEDDWGERWQGLLVTNPDGTTNYDSQANQLKAKNLKGHLLLAHGTMDTNVPPNNTLLVVNALIAANKDFDLIMLPNRNHGFGNEPYMVRRRWDYFVRYLMGATPPFEYQLTPPKEPGS